MSDTYDIQEFDGVIPSEADAPTRKVFRLPDRIKSGDRHKTLFGLLRSQKGRGISFDAAVAACDVENRTRCDPPLPAKDLEYERWWDEADAPLPDADKADAHQRSVQREAARLRAKRDATRLVQAEERGTTTPPAVITLTELLKQPDTETPWRVEDLQPRHSRVIFAAQFKAGKTTGVANLIRSLRDGDPFLGKYAVSPVTGRIALIDVEMSPNKLRQWYRDQRIKNTDGLLIVPMRGLAASFNIIDQHVRAEWVQRLRGVEYLVLDCLRPILDGLGLDEHHDVGVFLVAFDALLTEAGISDAMIVHHMGHANERSRGDSRLRDWPDVEWRLMRKDEDPASPRFFVAYGRDVDVAEQQLGYDAATRRLTVVGGSRRDAKVAEALPAVLAFIDAATEPPGRNAIVKGLKESGHARNLIDAALKFGVKAGKIATKPGKQGALLHSITTEIDTRPEF